MNGFALWNLAFRPFYLLASIFTAFSGLAWAAQYSGWLPTAYLQGPLWHGHEMLFGYTLAVVAGFLLTAVRAWTGQPTAAGDRKSTRLNSSHGYISYAVFCLKKKKKKKEKKNKNKKKKNISK